MRRILVLLSVVALMVVMLAMSVTPAFAAAPLYFCTDGTGASTLGHKSAKFWIKHPELGVTCTKIPK